MDASLILSRLPINGATVVAGSSAYDGYLPILGDDGCLDISTLALNYSLTSNSLTLPHSVLAADGSASFADAKIHLNTNGSATFNNGDIQLNTSGDILTQTSGSVFSEISKNGRGTFSGASHIIIADGATGALTFDNGAISLNSSTGTLAFIANNGSAMFGTGTIQLGSAGSASFASGTATIDSSGHAVLAKLNNITFNNPTGTCAFTLANGKSVTINNTLTLAGTDSSTLNISTGGTLTTSAFTDTTNASNISSGTLTTAINAVGKAVSVTDNQFSIKDHLSHSAVAQFDVSGITSSATRIFTLPDYNATLASVAGVETFTNKTYDTAGTGNVFKINGTQVTAITGTGSAVLATSPTLVTPVLGAASATSLTSTGDVSISTAGNGLKIKGGTNARVGQSTLVTGTVTISNTSVTTNTRVFVSRHGGAGTFGYLDVSVSAGTSFTITSKSAPSTTQTGDTSVVDWFLVEQT